MLLRLTPSHLVLGLILSAPLPALAGPAGAVHCQDPTTQRATFSAFDIALTSSPVRLYRFQAKSPLGGQQLQMETLNIQGSLISMNDQVASVRYARADGTLAQAMVHEFEGTRVATVKQVDYYNVGLDEHGSPTGHVVVKLADGPTSEFVFKGCRYEGALVHDWQVLWNAR